MHTSAFGVEHWETVEKKDLSHNERANSYRKTKNTLAAMGGTAAGLGAVTGGIAAAEYKGKDPVGLTLPEEPGTGAKKYSPAATKRYMRLNAAAHGRQAAAAGVIGAGALGLAGAYRKAEKKERLKNLKVSKADTKSKAKDAGTAALGTGAVGAGVYNAKHLTPAAAVWGGHAHMSHQALQGDKQDKWRLTPSQKKYYTKARSSAARTAGLKGAGAAASLGVAGLGAKAVYDVGSRNVKERKVSKGLPNPMPMSMLTKPAFIGPKQKVGLHTSDLLAPKGRPDTIKMTGSQTKAVRSSVRQGKHGMPGKNQQKRMP